MHPSDAQALILMLNAIRLQLFAVQMHEPSKELKECLVGSALMADEAMELEGLKDNSEPPALNEVGCQVNLTNGEHYGPCKGSCGPEKHPLTALSEYLESEAHRWETEHTPHHPGGQCDFRDGVVSGYRWAKTKLDDALDMI